MGRGRARGKGEDLNVSERLQGTRYKLLIVLHG